MLNTCATCDRAFETPRRSTFCSPACRQKAHRARNKHRATSTPALAERARDLIGELTRRARTEPAAAQSLQTLVYIATVYTPRETMFAEPLPPIHTAQAQRLADDYHLYRDRWRRERLEDIVKIVIPALKTPE
jgi:hypothetical protein